MRGLTSGIGVLLALAAVESAAAQEPDVDYAFRLVETRPMRVEASLEVAGADDGVNVFILWARMADRPSPVADLCFMSIEGQPLAAELAGDYWIVRHDPGVRVRAEWTIVDATGSAESESESIVWPLPIVEDDVFCVSGLYGILRPRRPDPGLLLAVEHDLRPARLSLLGFLERGWDVASTLGDGTRVDTTVEELDESIVVAGRLRFDELAVGPFRMRVIGAGDRAGSVFDSVLDLVGRTTAAAIETFDERAPTTLLAVLVASSATAGSGIHGVSVDDGFVLHVPSAADPASGGRDARELAEVVAHEVFHFWNGCQIRPGGLPRDMAWFLEGVTDHGARRLLLRSGVWSAREYVDDLNRRLASYFDNPNRGAPSHRVEWMRYVDKDFRVVPYELGDYAALLIDREMRRDSGGARTIDDFMRAVLQQARSSDLPVNADCVFRIVADLTSSDFASVIRLLVHEGHDVRPDRDDFGPPLRLVSKEIRDRDTGERLTVPQLELGQGSPEALRDQL